MGWNAPLNRPVVAHAPSRVHTPLRIAEAFYAQGLFQVFETSARYYQLKDTIFPYWKLR